MKYKHLIIDESSKGMDLKSIPKIELETDGKIEEKDIDWAAIKNIVPHWNPTVSVLNIPCE